MENDKIAKRIKQKQQRIKLHEVKNNERKQNIEGLKAAYIAAKGDAVLEDILNKARAFASYHETLARDGVGYRNTGHKLSDGTSEQETVFYTNEQRISHLDKSAGIQELIDYIERQLKITTPIPVPTETVDPTTAE